MVGAVIAVAVVGTASWLCLSNGLVGWHFAQLYRYQLAKLAQAAPAADTVVLVGDSSLGNAVDARAWSAALQRPVLSLALTGDYGYQGTLNMLRRALRHGPVGLVVVFQTLDIATRKPAYDGQLYTAQHLGDLAGIPPLWLFSALASLDPLASAVAAALRDEEDMRAYAAVDYHPQAAAGARRALAPVDAPPPQVERIRQDDLASLAQIAAVCRRHRVRCLYVHGPLIEPQCGRAAGYVRALSAAIERTGLAVVPDTPICLPRADAGDAEDHVAPERKAQYSDLYLHRLQSMLSGASSIASDSSN